MAIKTVDIGSVNWSDVMKNMPVATEYSNGLMSSSDNVCVPQYKKCTEKQLCRLIKENGDWNRSTGFVVISSYTVSRMFLLNVIKQSGNSYSYTVTLINGNIDSSLKFYGKDGYIYFYYNTESIGQSVGIRSVSSIKLELVEYESLDGYDEITVRVS